jgi:prolyl 4-hydroxylase
LLHSNLLAGGLGGEADWPGALATLRRLEARSPQGAAQLALLSEMALEEDGSPRVAPARRLISETPRVTLGEQLLSPAECRYLRSIGTPMLQPSVIIDPHTGRMVPHPVRTSEGAAFGVHSEDLVVNAVNRRIASFSGTSYEQGEPLQMLSYRAGAEYRPHMDALGGEPNQRILTVIVYLSDDYGDGETAFPRTGFTVRGKAGDAILFRNVLADGRPDPISLHAGRPVTRGTKVIATRWIRRSAFRYPPPQPLLAL